MNRQQVLSGLLAVGVFVAVVGIALGFIPMHQGPISCGSLFAPANPYSMGSVAGMDACDAASGTRAGIVWTLIGLGVAVSGLVGLRMLGDCETEQSGQPALHR